MNCYCCIISVPGSLLPKLLRTVLAHQHLNTRYGKQPLPIGLQLRELWVFSALSPASTTGGLKEVELFSQATPTLARFLFPGPPFPSLELATHGYQK